MLRVLGPLVDERRRSKDLVTPCALGMGDNAGRGRRIRHGMGGLDCWRIDDHYSVGGDWADDQGENA